jgi:dTDP-glucose 4,6-dehydratase
MKKYLVTGGFGFIGSNFIIELYSRLEPASKDFEIHCIDSMTYAAEISNLPENIRNSEKFVHHKMDISSQEIQHIFKDKFEWCINFAAESHVDRSIDDASPFMVTNIIGVSNLLAIWTKTQSGRFLQVSTDEVYGSIEKGSADENYKLLPSSPYSASKASADLIALSIKHTFNTDVVITRCCNNYGLNQNDEKFIPRMIKLAKEAKPFELYGSGKQIREWIHVSDHVKALLLILGTPELSSDIYNIGSGKELSNLEVVNLIAECLQSESARIVNIADRLGHDFRYSLKSNRIQQELTWKCSVSFEDGLTALISI